MVRCISSVITVIIDIYSQGSNSVTPEEQARLNSKASADEQRDATEGTNNDLADSGNCTCTCGRKRQREERSNGRTCKKSKVSKILTTASLS
jgi:hypothetical protein